MIEFITSHLVSSFRIEYKQQLCMDHLFNITRAQPFIRHAYFSLLLFYHLVSNSLEMKEVETRRRGSNKIDFVYVKIRNCNYFGNPLERQQQK